MFKLKKMSCKFQNCIVGMGMVGTEDIYPKLNNDNWEETCLLYKLYNAYSYLSRII